MSRLPEDPFKNNGIVGFAAGLRSGQVKIEDITRLFLDRIDKLNGRLGALEYVAHDSATETACALDDLLAAGVDLGPLMGVPIVIKDLFAVDGMTATAGSNIDVADLIGKEGSFVKSLRRAGCVILGKAATVEFALGGTGINLSRGTPWNPADSRTARIPGGSSSGSGVAVASAMCGFAIGTDTGGSVRLPACFCGVFGHKTSPGLYPVDGVYPLSPVLDTIGTLTRSAIDAALVYSCLTGEKLPDPVKLGGMRLARPDSYYFDSIDANVKACFDASMELLKAEGVEIVSIHIPEAKERDWFFPNFLPVECVAAHGRERFNQIRDKMDPVVAKRAGTALDIDALTYAKALHRHLKLKEVIKERLAGFHGMVTPTSAIVAPPVSAFDNVDQILELNNLVLRNTQTGNMFGMCGTTIPIHHIANSPLPVGLQILHPGGSDAQAVAVAVAIERLLGKPVLNDMALFMS
jgi:aspartyl-tRNA(Asn)/glutamyl-tRNA(Gln) amidotransferase subunit A